jgi:hypothetical protein
MTYPYSSFMDNRLPNQKNKSISLDFHLLLGLVYACLDYYVFYSVELFLLILEQVLLFWLFTRLIPTKWSKRAFIIKAKESNENV